MSVADKIDSQFPVQMTPAQFQEHLKQCDGICKYCATITLGIAEPAAEGVYCPNCENKSVLGMTLAKNSGVVLVVQD